MFNKSLRTLVEIAILAGLGYVLGLLKFSGPWVQGGSISLIMLPIFMAAFRHGPAVGTVTGLLVGLLHLMGGYVVHPLQLLLDYPLAYAAVGAAGVYGAEKPARAIIFGCALRFVSHFLSGWIWFAAYAPEGLPVILYTLLYNFSYLVPEGLITYFVFKLLLKKDSSGRIFKV